LRTKTGEQTHSQSRSRNDANLIKVRETKVPR